MNMLTPEEIRSAMFIDTYFPVIDGVVQTVHNYALNMNKRSYSCVVCPKGKEEYDDSQLGYDVFREVSVSFPKVEYSLAAPLDPNILKALKSRNCNIFHAHSPFNSGIQASLLARYLEIPVVATFHSKYWSDAYQYTHSTLAADLMAKWVVTFYNSCDAVWACSEGTAETLRSYGYQGDITIMTNGTNFKAPENPDELRERAQKEFDLPQGKHTLLFVGHQIWQKNLKLVLDTFRLLCDESDDYRLVIVGKGIAEQEVKDYAASLGLSDRIVFTGGISDRGLLSGVFLNADLFFFPSVYDNTPLVVREAAAMAIPSLLTKGSNAAESVDPGVNGFVAEEKAEAMRDEIRRVFAEPGYVKAIGRKAKETIPIPWEDLIPRVYDQYAQIIDRKQFEIKSGKRRILPL